MDVTQDSQTFQDNPTRRFLLDLEFVQALANPKYLTWLAQHEKKFLEEKEFIAYLKYLLYWKDPAYARFISFPHCLFVLDLLQEDLFRKSLSNPYVTGTLETQQYLHWKYYKKNRSQPKPTDQQMDQPNSGQQ